MTKTKPKEVVSSFEMVDRAALHALSEKGKADPTAVRTVRCRTVAEGRRFRHLNFIRNLPPHIVDEPPQLLGDDTAPNPTEALLAALGTCVSVGIQANAAARGWTVRGIELDTDGASPAELDELVAHAAKWSPVLNTVRNPVQLAIERA